MTRVLFKVVKLEQSLGLMMAECMQLRNWGPAAQCVHVPHISGYR